MFLVAVPEDWAGKGAASLSICPSGSGVRGVLTVPMSCPGTQTLKLPRGRGAATEPRLAGAVGAAWPFTEEEMEAQRGRATH